MRRNVLEPRGALELLSRDLRVDLRRRPEPGRPGADRSSRRRIRKLSRRRVRDRARRAIDAIAAAIRRPGRTDGDRARRRNGGLPGRATISGRSRFAPELHGVSGREYRVMQIQDGKLSYVETPGGARRRARDRGVVAEAMTDGRHGHPQSGPEDRSGPLPCRATSRACTRSRREPRASPARGRGTDRAERRREDDARERPHRLRPPERRDWSSSKTSTSRLAGAPPGATGLARTFQHGHLFGGLGARENVEVAALGVGRAARRGAPAARRAAGRAGPGGARRCAGGDPAARRRAQARCRACAGHEARGSCSWTSRRPGFTRARSTSSPASSHACATSASVGVLLIDHNIGLILGVCDRIHVLDKGGRSRPARRRRSG